MESERPDALFHDPYARKLAGERGERILASMRKGRAWAWPMIVRTAVMDELILRAIRRDAVATVLNLAAGADTPPPPPPRPPGPPSFPSWLDRPAVPRPAKMVEEAGGQAVGGGHAPFLVGPAQGTPFFEPHGWREAEYRSMWEESLRLKRTMRGAWLWSLIGRLYPKSKREQFRRMSGIVLLERI